jgi:arrestin-related trafficking adapter 3/6
MSQKNTLTIRLTESVVFLRNVDGVGRRPGQSNTGSTSLLRGLLVLDLAKPTRISSIEIDLTGKVMTSWPEGGNDTT